MADVLSPKDINPPTLKKLFDEAYMDTTLDNDGDLRVEEDGLGCYVLPINNGDRVKLLTVWQARGGCPSEKRLEFARKVNAAGYGLRDDGGELLRGKREQERD